MKNKEFELINTDPQSMHVLDSNEDTDVEMTPMILKKKINDKANIIPLKTPNSLGHIRHFPASTKEWSSSIYAYYNNNDIKSIPALDKKLVKLIKSFLNFYHQSEKLKSKRIHLRFRRLSLKKIFVNKAELKHTNSKVIINIHVYNIQKRLLMEEIDRMKMSVLYPKTRKKIKPTEILSIPQKLKIVKTALSNPSPFIFVILMQLIEKEKLLIIKNKKKCINKEDIPFLFYLLKERLYKAYQRKEIEKEKFLMCKYNLDYRSINEWDFPFILSLIEDIEKEKIFIKNLLKSKTSLFSHASREFKKVLYAIPLFYSIIKVIRVKPRVNKVYPSYISSLYKNIWVKCLEKELELIRYYKFLLDLYDHKFKCLIPKLKEVIGKIYKKKVEFNIVSLKHMYLNSDILTQAIVLKLKVRDNNVWRVLKSCLNMVKLPNTDRLKEMSKAIKPESLVDKIQKLDLNSISYLASLDYPIKGEEAKQDNDSLNQILFGIMSLPPCFVDKEGFIRLAKAPEGTDKDSSPLKPSIIRGISELPSIWAVNYFYFKNCLKHKTIGGVRLEAKGRLTRRFTASRSVFKLKWKGSLKNIDSSYKGLSAVMLRGHVKSNVQYTIINSKNRNGAYGVKGWVSGK